MVNNSWGHGNEKHSSDKVMNKEEKDLFKNKLIYEKINSQYLKKSNQYFRSRVLIVPPVERFFHGIIAFQS